MHALYKGMFFYSQGKASVWNLCGGCKQEKNWPSVTPSLVLSQQQQAFDRGGRGQWSHLFLNTHLTSVLPLSCSLLHYPSSQFLLSLSSLPFHPIHTAKASLSDDPGYSFFFLYCQVSQPNLNTCASLCVSVCEHVCNRFRPGCANMAWWVC